MKWGIIENLTFGEFWATLVMLAVATIKAEIILAMMAEIYLAVATIRAEIFLANGAMMTFLAVALIMAENYVFQCSWGKAEELGLGDVS